MFPYITVKEWYRFCPERVTGVILSSDFHNAILIYYQPNPAGYR
jgi:hypothetical protein